MPLVWDPILLQRIGQLVDRAPNVFSVCTGSILLAATGRLDGRKATTNKRLYDELTPKRIIPPSCFQISRAHANIFFLIG